jgi:hypothetical protein
MALRLKQKEIPNQAKWTTFTDHYLEIIHEVCWNKESKKPIIEFQENYSQLLHEELWSRLRSLCTTTDVDKYDYAGILKNGLFKITSK